MNTSRLQIETELIVRLRQEAADKGTFFTARLEDIPEEVGGFGLDDGLRGLGGGVTWNMRKSCAEWLRQHAPKRPVFHWQPDADGSTALWLDGKIRCSECGVVLDMRTNEEDEHYERAHGIRRKRDCECDD